MKSSPEEILSDLARLHMKLRRRFDRTLAEQGLSLARTKVLMMIKLADGALRATDIADRFGVAPRTVTETLDSLERENLIVRVPDQVDRRAKLLQVTAAGDAAIELTRPLREELAKSIMSVLTDKESAALHGAIRKILHGSLLE